MRDMEDARLAAMLADRGNGYSRGSEQSKHEYRLEGDLERQKMLERERRVRVEAQKRRRRQEEQKRAQALKEVEEREAKLQAHHGEQHAIVNNNLRQHNTSSVNGSSSTGGESGASLGSIDGEGDDDALEDSLDALADPSLPHSAQSNAVAWDIAANSGRLPSTKPTLPSQRARTTHHDPHLPSGPTSSSSSPRANASNVSGVSVVPPPSSFLAPQQASSPPLHQEASSPVFVRSGTRMFTMDDPSDDMTAPSNPNVNADIESDSLEDARQLMQQLRAQNRRISKNSCVDRSSGRESGYSHQQDDAHASLFDSLQLGDLPLQPPPSVVERTCQTERQIRPSEQHHHDPLARSQSSQSHRRPRPAPTAIPPPSVVSTSSHTTNSSTPATHISASTRATPSSTGGYAQIRAEAEQRRRREEKRREREAKAMRSRPVQSQPVVDHPSRWGKGEETPEERRKRELREKSKAFANKWRVKAQEEANVARQIRQPPSQTPSRTPSQLSIQSTPYSTSTATPSLPSSFPDHRPPPAVQYRERHPPPRPAYPPLPAEDDMVQVPPQAPSYLTPSYLAPSYSLEDSVNGEEARLLASIARLDAEMLKIHTPSTHTASTGPSPAVVQRDDRPPSPKRKAPAPPAPGIGNRTRVVTGQTNNRQPAGTNQLGPSSGVVMKTEHAHLLLQSR